jgi:SAM-dependent methyltransferase
MDKATEQYLLEIVKYNYQKIAEEFDVTRKNRNWPELVKFSQDIETGDRILDVGCGNGRLLEILKEKQIEYLGVDLSLELINIAKARFPNDKFLLGDILELGKLPEKDFNYIFCVALFHHLPGKDLRIKALKQLANKLEDNGKIIITVWNLWSQKKFLKLILKYAWLKILGKHKFDFGDILFDWKNSLGERLSQRYYHAFTRRELQKIIIQTGLKIERLYKDKYNYYLILHKDRNLV